MESLGFGAVGTGANTAGPDGGLYTSQTQTGLGNNGYGTINGGIMSIDTDGDGLQGPRTRSGVEMVKEFRNGCAVGQLDR